MTDFVELVVNAMFTGVGTAMGAFLGTRLVVKRAEELIAKLKPKNGNGT